MAFGLGRPCEVVWRCARNIIVVGHFIEHPKPEHNQNSHDSYENDHGEGHNSILHRLEAVGAAEATSTNLPLGLAVETAVSAF